MGICFFTVYSNEFWSLKYKLVAINGTVELLGTRTGPNISLTYQQPYLQVDQSFQIQCSYSSMLERLDHESRQIRG
jgi:hypothetical protein